MSTSDRVPRDDIDPFDLQQRLISLGYPIAPDELGRDIGASTRWAIVAFQTQRGLRADGECRRDTWNAIIESCFSLGDRLLYERKPALRGDDVVDLQQRLNALGFDTGRIDGIAGPRTFTALRAFQRDAGLAVDGIAGPTTLSELRRLGTMAAGQIAAVREREWLRNASRNVTEHPLFLVVAPELGSLGELVRGGLANAGVPVILETSGGDEHEVAQAANAIEAQWLLAIRPGNAAGCQVHYYGSGQFVSAGGSRLAEALVAELSQTALRGPHRSSGKAYPILRETRIPAVVVELLAANDVEATRVLVSNAVDVAQAIVGAFISLITTTNPED
jgi:N-acetylmuramoyl-L-alanine amidase